MTTTLNLTIYVIFLSRMQLCLRHLVWVLHNKTRVGRKHQYIMNLAQTLKFQDNLPIQFQGECVLETCYLINHAMSKVFNYFKFYEKLFGEPHMFTNMKAFCCLYYAHHQCCYGNKFASRSQQCIFLGYSYGQKGCKLYDFESNKYCLSKCKKFDGHEFFFFVDSPDNTPYSFH